MALLSAGTSVTSLARSIGYKRNTVSLVIHNKRKCPGVTAAIKKELGI
ncbi:MAG: hypothetical protein JWR69_3050 [Pedosphaera sp.]|nr:hypothetical protein [Pedosphaera sp.]